MSTTKHYTIKLTGGTSPGPYTIFYNYPYPPYFATLYDVGPTALATGLTRTQLTTGDGINVEVPSSANVLYLYNEYCLSGITLVPPSDIVYKDFCLTISSKGGGLTFLHFSPSVLVNGYPSWVEDNFTSNGSITVTYNGTLWVVNGFTTELTTITSTDVSTANPPSVNWMINGGSDSVRYKLGSCQPTRRESFPVSVNQPTCLCDGSIIFNSNLDNPPFAYSIDNGVTFTSSPIFTELCSGIYILVMTDSIGETYSKTITMNKPELSTTYSLSLSTTNTNPISNEVSLVNSYETIVNITPPLPDGTTITFDLIHNNSFYSGPLSGTSILTTGTVVTKNTSTITINNTVTGDSQSVNTTPGCQSNVIYQSDTNEVWNSITLTNLDTITISTTTRVDKTTAGLCVVGYSNDTYSISNATINGCDCCSLIINT